MPETANKRSGSSKCKSNEKQNGVDKFIQLTKKQLEDLIENTINKAIKPLKEKIFELENQIKEIRKSQTFISKKYDDLTAEHVDNVLNNKQQQTDFKDNKRRPENLQKINLEEQFKLDEVEEYDRRQNLEFQGVPFKDNEDVTHITLDLVNKLGVDLKEKDISIAHRLFQRQRP